MVVVVVGRFPGLSSEAVWRLVAVAEERMLPGRSGFQLARLLPIVLVPAEAIRPQATALGLAVRQHCSHRVVLA